MRTTPDNISDLKANEIFVFGSNTGGFHGKGAALHAKMCFGAEQHVGEGLTGRCYAFPTLQSDAWDGNSWIGLHVNLKKRKHVELYESSSKFIVCAVSNPHLIFLLTKVGCGLAGYTENYMKTFFTDTPTNVIKPEGW